MCRPREQGTAGKKKDRESRDRKVDKNATGSRNKCRDSRTHVGFNFNVTVKKQWIWLKA